MAKTTAEILGELRGIFSRVLERDDVQVTEGSTAADVEGWDSLTHNELIAGIEAHFGTKFTLKEQARFQNVGDICKAIQARTGA